MAPQPIVEMSELELDFENPLYDREEIRRVNPQRFEMEQLTGVVWVNRKTDELIGFKDVTEDEFWIRGHMPDFPIMPGVVLCECAAQLAGFYARKFDIMGGDYLGFGGMNDVRFRRPVFPNSRLVLIARATKIKPRLRSEFLFQGFVEGKLVFNGEMIGVPIMKQAP